MAGLSIHDCGGLGFGVVEAGQLPLASGAELSGHGGNGGAQLPLASGAELSGHGCEDVNGGAGVGGGDDGGFGGGTDSDWTSAYLP
jgi:hypothetical protein